ncbi:MAG TPA: nucleotidyl transferase AbiEii/AbiGii toxin family protein [Solirubrobacteraceae bacterium]|jgi:predicted nucleotidyltransferase|nr:nucleotidyl transferase AbiEii/AbiGii toxin family protein [Solirubrobacteraceae bacterium]
MSGFGEILDDLNRSSVRYVLIGGIALIRHGVVRATRDVDAIIAPDPKNLERLRVLVAEWGATRPDGSPLPDDALLPGRTIHLATPHGELDLLAELLPPLSFTELSARAETRRVDGVEAPICSLADLVALKRIAGRERDFVDLHDLEVAHGELPDSRIDLDPGED